LCKNKTFQLIVETADMLHIPLFTAEALLRQSEWSREVLLEQWMRDPVSTCQTAGVQPPFTALHLRGGLQVPNLPNFTNICNYKYL
jgi:ankyrin repeat/IBR domain-containing protein 1